jgi:ABC-type nitrate/sulfonate/bicarbonate transport system permease component
MKAIGRQLARLAERLLLPLVLVAAWWLISAGSKSPFFPPLAEILAQFPQTWFGDRVLSDVLPSLGRLGVGLLLAAIVGIALGILIGSTPWLRTFLEPALEFARAIPAPALVPILMVLVGIGDSMRVIVIVVGAVWPILLNTVEGVRNIDLTLRDTCSVFQFRAFTRLRVLMLRAASPQIFAGLRQALSIGIILMVVSEMFAATAGIGFSLIQFQRSFSLVEMWTGILMLGILGVILSLIFRLIERRMLAWYYATQKLDS